MKKFFIVAVFCLICFQANAYVKVLDGDSLVLNNVEIRLQGIDAPEYNQICYNSEGQEYACGLVAKNFLSSLLTVEPKCQKISTDKYGRQVSVCYVNNVDIAQKMVQNGWAVAYLRYSKLYEKDQSEAKKTQKGLWHGRFMLPELHRILNKD